MMRLILSVVSILALLTMIKAQGQSGACSPSPCLNYGRCIPRDNERGYECKCWFTHGGVNCSKENYFSIIRYTIMNNVTNDAREFYYSEPVFAWATDLYDIMVKFAERDPRYRFKATYSEGLGYFITEMNGLKQDANANLYWFIVIQRGWTTPWCRSVLGASSYKPKWFEHVMFMYNTWEKVSKLPECAKDG